MLKRAAAGRRYTVDDVVAADGPEAESQVEETIACSHRWRKRRRGGGKIGELRDLFGSIAK